MQALKGQLHKARPAGHAVLRLLPSPRAVKRLLKALPCVSSARRDLAGATAEKVEHVPFKWSSAPLPPDGQGNSEVCDGPGQKGTKYVQITAFFQLVRYLRGKVQEE